MRVRGGCCSGASRVRVRGEGCASLRRQLRHPEASIGRMLAGVRRKERTAWECQTSQCLASARLLLQGGPLLPRALFAGGPVHARRRPAVALLNLRTAPIVEAVATVLPVRALRSDCLRTQQGHAVRAWGFDGPWWWQGRVRAGRAYDSPSCCATNSSIRTCCASCTSLAASATAPASCASHACSSRSSSWCGTQGVIRRGGAFRIT